MMVDELDHSTSELPFQMDTEYEHVIPRRNHLVQRFRAITEPPIEYKATSHSGRNTPPNHIFTQRSEGPGTMQFSLHRQPQSTTNSSDLETSTQTLKNLLSIKSTPSNPSTPPFSAVKGPPSPSPSRIHHNRTRSAAQVTTPRTRMSPPTNSNTQPSRRVFSSGVPPNTDNHSATYTESLSSPADQEPISEEIKMEKELRKVLNLSS